MLALWLRGLSLPKCNFCIISFLSSGQGQSWMMVRSKGHRLHGEFMNGNCGECGHDGEKV